MKGSKLHSVPGSDIWYLGGLRELRPDPAPFYRLREKGYEIRLSQTASWPVSLFAAAGT